MKQFKTFFERTSLFFLIDICYQIWFKDTINYKMCRLDFYVLLISIISLNVLSGFMYWRKCNRKRRRQLARQNKDRRKAFQ